MPLTSGFGQEGGHKYSQYFKCFDFNSGRIKLSTGLFHQYINLNSASVIDGGNNVPHLPKAVQRERLYHSASNSSMKQFFIILFIILVIQIPGWILILGRGSGQINDFGNEGIIMIYDWGISLIILYLSIVLLYYTYKREKRLTIKLIA